MNRPRFKLSLALTFASGVAALAHETLWTRRLVDVLGASAETFSKVVGAFFLGLALGAWCAARWRKNSWRGVALTEFAVGLLAIPILFSPWWSEILFANAALAPWMKFILPIAIILPPALAMGLVLPWLLNVLARDEIQPRGFAVWIYAANTFGGIAGIAAVLLSPVPALGLMNFGLLICGLNFLVAAFALTLHQFRPKIFSENSEMRETREAEFTSAEEKFFAFISGFLVLSLEVVLQHQFAQVTINSQFSAGTVLALVLLALGIAALLLPFLVQKFGDKRALQFSLLATAICATAQPLIFTSLRHGVTILPYELTLLPYTLAIFKLGMIAGIPIFVAAGLIFPLLLRRNARAAAKLLAWNGLGGWFGTELTQDALSPLAGIWLSVEIIGAIYFLVWLIFVAKGKFYSRTKFFQASIGFACLMLGFIYSQSLPQATILPGEHLAAVRAGREGVVATVECAPDDWRILFNNSYTLGGSKAQFNQERQGLLPLLLHGNPKSVATLGIATGGTVAGVSLFPGVERIDAIELSPLVLQQAREFFAPFDRNIFHDARVHFITEDARWVMAREQNQYDVIIGDLFLPWRTGEGRLFTLEHFQNVRRALKPDGIYCQWLPLFQLTRKQFETIARTFHEIFPDAFLVRGDFYFDLPIVGLVGGRDFSKMDWNQVKTNCEKIRAAGEVTDPLVRHAEGVAMLTLGTLPQITDGPINTLANSWLEWDAGHNIIGMKTPWFLGVPCAEYIRDVQRAGISQLPERFRVDQDVGQFFLTLEVAAALQLPAKANLEEQIPSRMPKVMVQDSAADWRQWPSRVKFSFTPIH